MTTFKNINWTKRNYDCTNLVYQVSDIPRNYQTGQADTANWEEVDAAEAAEIAEYAQLGMCYFADAKNMMKVFGMGKSDFYGFM